MVSSAPFPPYEIVATLGPASMEEATWRELLHAGATAFRLNTSHLTLTDLHTWLRRLLAFRHAAGTNFPLVLDLQGSKWRLGAFAPFTLEAGQVVDLTFSADTVLPNTLPVPHPDFFHAAPGSSGEIVLNDARVRLSLVEARPDLLRARVTLAGEIAPNKGITFTASAYRVERLGEKDRAILEETRDFAGMRYAISYLRDAAEMARYRRLVTSLLDRPAYLVAKLERGPAVEEAAQVASSADELWLCRGDLGAELGLRDMAAAVHAFSTRVRSLPVPCLMAGQVLEHMTVQPTPTRSEACYLYDSLALGYRGFVLSDETAVGRSPLAACRAAALFHPA